MNLDYDTLHWGTPSKHVEHMRWPSGERGVLGARIKSISYVTRKTRAQTFQHDFGDTEDGMAKGYTRPRIIWLHKGVTTGAGSGQTPTVRGHNLVALGRIVDVELDDGRLYPVSHWICTEPNAEEPGGQVIIASRFGPVFAIEQVRFNGSFAPYITEHGIVA